VAPRGRLPPARPGRSRRLGVPPMLRVLAVEQRKHVGERVRLAGWLHRQRRLSRVSFLILRDRSGLGQVVVDDADEAERLAELPPETVVTVEGTVVAAASAPNGAELHDPEVEIVARPAERTPLDLWRPSLSAQLSTRLDLAPLALRHPREQAIFRLAAASIAGFRDALDGLGFTEIQTPKIVASATESGANVFAIDYFGRPAYLAQSPQFYKQAMVGVFERVYQTGPVFRAEPHDTPRHLSEYVSLDAELGFIADHNDVMAVARHAAARMVASVQRRAADAAALLELGCPAFRRRSRRCTSATRRRCSRQPPARTWPASWTSPPPTSAGWGSGHGESTARTSSSSPAIPWPSGRSIRTPSPAGWSSPTASISSSVASSSSRAAAAASLWRLPRRPRGGRTGSGRVRAVPAGLQVRDAAPWRVRDRARAVGRALGWDRQRSPHHAVPARPQPAHALRRVATSCQTRRCSATFSARSVRTCRRVPGASRMATRSATGS
jgi:hypothetical protein